MMAGREAAGYKGKTGDCVAHSIAIATGLIDLNKITTGWKKQDLIILAARPSMGKTALATNSYLTYLQVVETFVRFEQILAFKNEF